MFKKKWVVIWYYSSKSFPDVQELDRKYYWTERGAESTAERVVEFFASLKSSKFTYKIERT